jgi:hypothetical protein
LRRMRYVTVFTKTARIDCNRMRVCSTMNPHELTTPAVLETKTDAQENAR